MKLALLGVAAMAVAIAVGGSASASGASAGSSCKDRKFKVDGFPAVTGCGPATVVLKVSGTSYAFENGECQLSGTGSKRVLFLLLGSSVNDPKQLPDAKDLNHGYPYLELQTFGSLGVQLTAVSHGKDLVGVVGPGVIKYEGTYTGTFSFHGPPKITGSWNCHGVVR
jgi:hypothetical protein